jgi:hypothetical protein
VHRRPGLDIHDSSAAFELSWIVGRGLCRPSIVGIAGTMGGLGYLSVLSGLVAGIAWARIVASIISIAREIRATGQHHRAHIHAAQLTLLLVVLVLIDATANWVFVSSAGWHRGGLWPVVALPLLGGLYFYAATLTLPTGIEKCTQLNGWFWITRRPVLIAVLFADLLWFSLSELARRPDQILLAIAGAALNIAAMIRAGTSTKRHHAAAALIVLIAERAALAAVSLLA